MKKRSGMKTKRNIILKKPDSMRMQKIIQMKLH